MFVIVNSIEQTPLNLEPNERFIRGMKHAGPSITIAALTGVLAFLLGAITTLTALRSFCIFAACCLVALYFAFLTLFASFYINDLRRIHAKKGDCCGLCCCENDTVLCCRGRFLSKRQKEFVGMDLNGMEEDAGENQETYASGVERFLHLKYAPMVLSTRGRKIIIVIWCILTAIGIFAST